MLRIVNEIYRILYINTVLKPQMKSKRIATQLLFQSKYGIFSLIFNNFRRN